MNNTIEAIFIDEHEASKLTGMSTAWFQRCRWAGDGPPFVKLASAVRYEKNTLLDYFKSRTIQNTSQSSQAKAISAA